ncbi:hypothetical protein ACLM5H_05075 [Fredinandcohnia humi]
MEKILFSMILAEGLTRLNQVVDVLKELDFTEEQTIKAVRNMYNGVDEETIVNELLDAHFAEIA